MNWHQAIKAAAISVTIFFSNTAMAGGFEKIDAQKEIDECLAVGRTDRDSGVTSQMRQGGAKTAECLEDRIVEHLKALFKGREGKTFPDGKTKFTEAGFREILEQLSISYQGLYWSLYNDHAGCKGGCGTMYTTFHLGKYMALLEQILKDVVAQRNEFRL